MVNANPESILKTISILFLLNILLWSACRGQKKDTPLPADSTKTETRFKYFLGADLSYINELETCGASYKVNGIEKDPFQLFGDKGASIARFRLWHKPEWTQFSTLKDIKKSIRRARDRKMRILLDFHYSDTWTDPARQNIPAAWKSVKNVEILGDSLFNYTKRTLMELHHQGLLPELVQVGNEINAEILQYSEPAVYPINWPRNISLLNKGIKAVREVSEETGKPIEIVLHIAQPENADPWFTGAKANGIASFDWIGLSYYSQWSKFNLAQLGTEIEKLKLKFGKRVIVVECGYPFTIHNGDAANNLLDTTSQLPGYLISQNEQKRFIIDLTKTVIQSGGEGVIYWEPAWISTSCKTRWATGSHWDNATFFDQYTKNALPVFDFLNEKNY